MNKRKIIVFLLGFIFILAALSKNYLSYYYDRLVLGNYQYEVSCSDFLDLNKSSIDACTMELSQVKGINIQYFNIDEATCPNKIGISIIVLGDKDAQNIIAKWPSRKLQCGAPYKIING